MPLSARKYKCSAEISGPGKGYVRLGHQVSGNNSKRIRKFGEYVRSDEALDYTINLRQNVKKFQLIFSVKETGSSLYLDNVSCIKQ